MYQSSIETKTEKQGQIHIDIENGSIQTKNAEPISFNETTHIRANTENGTNTKNIIIESYNETEIIHGSNGKDSENAKLIKLRKAIAKESQEEGTSQCAILSLQKFLFLKHPLV